jgi:RNA polymerase sigma-70 factor (sigma-E family)
MGPISESADFTVSLPIDVPALYAEHWRTMVRLAVLLIDDLGAAEDIVQDAFLALHRKADGLREPAAAVGYLTASIVNRSRSTIRHRQVVRKQLRVAEPDIGDAADHRLVLAEEHSEALAALRTLPRRQQEVLVLRYWSGLSEAEIADALGIGVGAVKSSASRGMAKLRDILGGAR